MSKIKKLLPFFYKQLFPEECLVELLCQLEICKKTGAEDAASFSQKKIHWSRFLELLKNNQLLLSSLIDRIFIELKPHLPRRFQKELIKYQLIISYTIQQQNKEYLSMIKKLAKSELDFVVMKTYQYSRELSGLQEFRMRSDLDLLIPIYEFKKATQLLLAEKYQYFPSHSSKAGLNTFPMINFHPPKTQEIFKRKNYTIELHTTIVDNFYFYIKPIDEKTNRLITHQLYEGSQEIFTKKQKIKRFLPTELFISLFLHSFFQHNLQGGITFYEFALVIKKFQKRIKWKQLIFFMKKIKMQKYFFWFLLLLDSLYPNILPPYILKKIRKYEKGLKFKHDLLFFYMRYKIFHPTNFLDDRRELEKEWCWAILDNKLLKLILHKIKNHFVCLTSLKEWNKKFIRMRARWK